MIWLLLWLVSLLIAFGLGVVVTAVACAATEAERRERAEL